MRHILFMVLLCASLPCWSQKDMPLQGKKSYSNNHSNLKEYFKAWEIFEIPTSELYDQVNKRNGNTPVQLTLGDQHQWSLLLSPNDLRSNSYRTQLATGEFFPKIKNKTFAGYELSLQGNKVRLTLDENFIYGYVEKGEDRWFIEPLNYFDPTGSKNLFVIYAEKNVIPKEGKICGVSEMNNKTKQLQNEHKHSPDAPEFAGQCYEVELAIASDFSMFQKYGDANGVENHNIGVMNNVSGNYDDDFADEVTFTIVTQFISNCPTCDPWVNTNISENVLDSFRDWGNNGGFGVNFDLGQFWTNRDFAGSTIGVAFLGAVCSFGKYHILQDFSTNASLLRVVTTHEIGHNFNADHDDFGSGTIMAPAANNTNTWSAGSVFSIESYITSLANNGNCFSDCTIPIAPVPDFTSNIENVCEGSVVQFFDRSENNPTSWEWQFPGGNITSSSSPNPLVTYEVAGTYDVILTVGNAVGSNTVTKTSSITVGTNGTAVLLWESFENGLDNWTITNPDNSNTWSLRTINGAENGNQAVFMDNWTYETGVGQRDALVSMPIDFSGYSNITLELDHAYTLWSGAATTYNDSLIIYLSTDNGNTYNRVFQDADNSSGNLSTVEPMDNEFFPNKPSDWCFEGNYGTSCLSIDLSAYAGEPNVILMLENYSDYGNNLYLDNIKITSSCQIQLPPAAAFTSNVTLGCAPLEVQFNDVSSGGISNWNWTFEGGMPNFSTEKNPTVIYETPGVYEVVLEVSNSIGTDLASSSNSIVIESAPIADFTSSVNLGDVFFTNNSSNAESYLWDFGDGNTSNSPTPIHTYAQDGIYTITLTAFKNCGSTTHQETIEVVTPVTADFTASVTSGCTPFEVQFNDLSSENTSSWNWIFEGASISNSNEKNPTVVYSQPGIYTVTLEVDNAQFSSTKTKTNYIVVGIGPDAEFSTIVSGTTATFANSSNNANTFQWNFGDGNTSTEENPTHTYAGAGTFTVTLTATNNCGSTTYTLEINTTTSPTADFTSNITSGCLPLVVQFNNQSSSNATNWSWTFENGSPSSSSLQNPQTTFNTPGIHTVTLEASNNAGTSISTMEISVQAPPSVGFSNDVNSLLVNFNNLSIGASSYLWDFGDGNTSTQENPQHEYPQGGNYVAALTATNECGSVIIAQTVEVVGPLTVAAFSSSASIGCAPLSVSFSDLSSNHPTEWNWQFEGGTPATSTQQNPTVLFETPGSYDVTLTATNFNGSNTISQTTYIEVDPLPVSDFSFTINAQGELEFTNNSVDATQYQWLFGDGNNSTEQDPSHTFASSDLFEITLIAINECGTDVMTQEVVINLTANDEIDLLEKFQLFPNPNDGQFILHLEGKPTNELNVLLYDLLGQKILEEQLDFSSGKIIQTYHLQDLPSANYILQIRTENKMRYKKVVIK